MPVSRLPLPCPGWSGRRGRRWDTDGLGGGQAGGFRGCTLRPRAHRLLVLGRQDRVPQVGYGAASESHCCAQAMAGSPRRASRSAPAIFGEIPNSGAAALVPPQRPEDLSSHARCRCQDVRVSANESVGAHRLGRTLILGHLQHGLCDASRRPPLNWSSRLLAPAVARSRLFACPDRL
jgi:hypothetical protein